MNKIQRTLIEAQIGGLKISKWFLSTYYYIIDSEYRTKRKLSKYLKDQLRWVSYTTYSIAMSLRGKDEEETIINILKWVMKNFRYKTDVDNYNKVEKWASIETMMHNKVDDCDGMNTVIYVLARIAGIGSDILYSTIGMTTVGGHFWLLFWSTNHDKLVAIDSTYHPSKVCVKNRPRFHLNKYKYQSLWYVFNEKITIKII